MARASCSSWTKTGSRWSAMVTVGDAIGSNAIGTPSGSELGVGEEAVEQGEFAVQHEPAAVVDVAAAIDRQQQV